MSNAILSACGTYRYRLEREVPTVAGRRSAAFIMVNPSTADEKENDPTIKKLIGFSARNGFSRFSVGNLFAYRATDVRRLHVVRDPVGPDNDFHLEQIISGVDVVVVSWGTASKLPAHLQYRWRELVSVADRMGCRLFCLGTAKDGHPRHPLMISYRTPLIGWSPNFVVLENA